jgi:lipopolysaccharide export system protein LptA
MNSITKIIRVLSWAGWIAALWLIFATCLFAEGDAHLSATSLIMEETEQGAILTLAGPVEITYKGDNLKSDSAIVHVHKGAPNLTEAIDTIDLDGNVTYESSDGAKGSASKANFAARDRELTLTGKVTFSKGTMSSSSSTVNYSMPPRTLKLTGNVTLIEKNISATGDSASYNLNTKVGDLEGSVVVRYKLGKAIFGNKTIDEVVLKAPALHVVVDTGEVSTPSDTSGERTTIQADAYTFAADTVVFRGSEQDGVTSIDGNGDVHLDGPEGSLSADKTTVSTEDRIFHASGNVHFSILGQEGAADRVEVNFAKGWSVKLSGGTIGGSTEQIPKTGT